MTMLLINNSVYTIDSYPSSSVYVPCCNVPVYTDYQPRHFQEIYYAPEPPPRVQVIRQRLPAPPPDVIDRVVVVPEAKQYVYQVVEVPSKPPPVIQQRYVREAPRQPICGGTYQVQVPSNSIGQSPVVIQSPSGLQLSSSNVIQMPATYPSSTVITV